MFNRVGVLELNRGRASNFAWLRAKKTSLIQCFHQRGFFFISFGVLKRSLLYLRQIDLLAPDKENVQRCQLNYPVDADTGSQKFQGEFNWYLQWQ